MGKDPQVLMMELISQKIDDALYKSRTLILEHQAISSIYLQREQPYNANQIELADEIVIKPKQPVMQLTVSQGPSPVKRDILRHSGQ